jgi:hypothetical protein
MPADVPSSARTSLGRRLGLVVFGLVVTAFTLVCSIQIIRQVWFPATTELPADCHAGVRDLILAVERGRRAAAAENGNEKAALARFRAQLDPEWSRRPAVERACGGHEETRRALRDVLEWRYSEEHAVRYEAADLARLRRRVHALAPGLRESLR